MFSDNNIISNRQLKRMIIAETLCISTITTTNISVHFAGRDGFLCIIIATLLALIYAAVILYLCNKTHWDFANYVRKKYGSALLNLLYFIFLLKYIALSCVVTALLVKIVRVWILTEVNFIVILIPIILLTMYSVSRGFEARARMAECLYYVIIIPVVLLLILSIKGTDPYYISPVFMESTKKILLGGIVLFLLFCPVEAVLFSSNNINVQDHKKRSKVTRSLYIDILLLGLINLIFFILNVGSQGAEQIKGDNLVTLRLMGKVNLSYFFLERQDELFLVFYVFGITMTIFFLMYMVNFLYYEINKSRMISSTITKENNKDEKSKVVKKNKKRPLVFSSFISSIILFAAVFIIIAYTPSFNKVTLSCEKKVDIDNISYADTLIFDVSNNQYQTTLIFPKESKNETKTRIFTTDRLSVIEDQYNKSSDKKLDYAHTQIIILSQNVLNNDMFFRNVIQYINDNKQIGKNVCICTIDQDVATFLQNVDKMQESLGDYINKMFQNNLDYGITTLNTVGKVEAGVEEACSLSIIENADGISYKGEQIVDQMGLVETDQKESSVFVKLLEGREGFNIQLGNNFNYKVDKNNYTIRVRKDHDQRLKVHITYYGRMDSNMNNILTEDELNEVLKQIITEKITTLLNEHNCDFLNIYKYIGASEKEIWADYKDKKPELYKKLDIEVSAQYKTS